MAGGDPQPEFICTIPFVPNSEIGVPAFGSSATSVCPIVTRMRDGCSASPCQYDTPRRAGLRAGYFHSCLPVSPCTAHTPLDDVKYTTLSIARGELEKRPPVSPVCTTQARVNAPTLAALICDSDEYFVPPGSCP